VSFSLIPDLCVWVNARFMKFSRPVWENFFLIEYRGGGHSPKGRVFLGTSITLRPPNEPQNLKWNMERKLEKLRVVASYAVCSGWWWRPVHWWSLQQRAPFFSPTTSFCRHQLLRCPQGRPSLIRYQCKILHFLEVFAIRSSNFNNISISQVLFKKGATQINFHKTRKSSIKKIFDKVNMVWGRNWSVFKGGMGWLSVKLRAS
jgi:hypothetical protein